MNKQTMVLLIRAILKSHNISDDMVIEYYTRTYDAKKVGIPARYFYLLVEGKINDAIQIVIDLAEQEDKVNRDYMVSVIRTEFLGS